MKENLFVMFAKKKEIWKFCAWLKQSSKSQMTTTYA